VVWREDARVLELHVLGNGDLDQLLVVGILLGKALAESE
jgi:hypothetical protein